MNIQVQISDDLVHGRNNKQLQRDITEGLIIIDYLNARLSPGEVAEKLGVDYTEIKNWLQSRGIDFKETTGQNREVLEKEYAPKKGKWAQAAQRMAAENHLDGDLGEKLEQNIHTFRETFIMKNQLSHK